MSAGSFGPDPGQPGPDPQVGSPQPPPPQYPQPGMYGYPVSPQFQQDYAPWVPVPRRTNGLAIAALCCGVGQVVAGPFAGIPAVVLGSMSLKQIRQTGEDGHGMAVAGLVLGIVGTLLVALVIVLITVFAITMVHNLPPPPVRRGIPG